ncbi:hypothetical protein [Pseudobythopirellula maris]|nr:hypothetical protein [Pseudobythopirellula maris]
MPAAIPGWDLVETVSGMPEATADSAQLSVAGNQPMETAEMFGIWLRPFVGNQNDLEGTNSQTNAYLSQTVPATSGTNYTFTGWSKWEQNYSGAVGALDFLSPSGGGTSPTESMFEVAFLDGGGAVLGAPVALDLRTVQFGDANWRQHEVMATAPAGTVSARVTASATDMIINIDPEQSAFYDNFSLTPTASPDSELLFNGDLNDPLSNPGWAVTEPPATNNASIAMESYANNTPGGGTGFWLRAFSEGDASVSQTVAGSAGLTYNLTAASKWEENYSGGLLDTDTETLLEIAFLDSEGEVLGDPATLDLRTVQMNDNTWRTHMLSAASPAGTAQVRVSGLATDMSFTDGGQSAFLDDFSLTVSTGVLAGDYNNNGTVDAADFTVWRDNLDTAFALPNETVTLGSVTIEDYNEWVSHFGDTSPGLASASGVPEPTAAVLALVGLLAFAGSCRRASSR